MTVAEAVLMALGITGRTGEVLVAESVHPEYRQVLATYLANLHCKLRVLPTPAGTLNPDDVAKAVTDQTVWVIAQSPNFQACEEAQGRSDLPYLQPP